MNEQLYSLIHSNGSIAPMNYFCSCKKQNEKDYSTEDYVAKITSIFSPYISTEISEKNFMTVQSEIKKVLMEMRGKTNEI